MAKNSISKRRCYLRNKANGLCPSCSRPARKGKVYCAVCAARDSASPESQMRRYRAKKLKGECTNCPKPAREGFTECDECSAKGVQIRRAKRKTLAVKGLCVVCYKRSSIDGQTSCQPCRDRTRRCGNDRRDRLEREGLCKACGSDIVAPFKLCEACRARGRQWSRARRLSVFQAYGNACACCGESNYYFLAIDHVRNNGGAERRVIGKSTVTLISKILRENFPSDYQLLCHNCNFAKGHWGSCPHTWEGNVDVNPPNQ